ncbi:type VI secretion system baseplate subunit TssG [Salicola sp. Rm-C-2C1-2]|uniref:type VI secretion system baseplate subunit TssG n=1 Tax=Salicola sp. Rm-C-2C1-2 TaxID=3141321 RepID=UPI0032E3ED92
MSTESCAGNQDFFRTVWRIERQIRDERSPYHRVGHDGWPSQELVCFRTSQHMGFAGQDLVEAREERRSEGSLSAELTVDSLGLTGARGALPAHYTEMVLSQLKARSPALRDFLDLFNHRLLSLFYRSWEKTQPAVHQERAEGDIFTTILRSLTGSESDWEIHYGAALARGPRSATTVRTMLEDVADMPVEVQSLQGGWESISPGDQTRLPTRDMPQGQHAHLGEAMLGSRAWIADKGADIVFHPRDNGQLESLLPGGRVSAAVAKLTKRLVGHQIQLRYRAETNPAGLKGTRLGQRGQLGSDSFISAYRTESRRVNISLKPSQGKDKQSCHQ